MAATGRSAAVGDRSRGCRRRSGWVRPGLGQAGPLLSAGSRAFVWARAGGREQRRRPRPAVETRRSGPERGAGPGGGLRDGLATLRHLSAGTKGAGPGSSRAPFPPGGWPGARRVPAEAVSGSLSAPSSDRSGKQVGPFFFFFFLTDPTQTLIVIFFTLSR